MDKELLWALLKLIIFLPLVLGLLYLTLRYGLGRRFLPGRGQHLEVVEQIPLGPKAVLSLVRVGERYYLIGHGEGAVTLLKELEGKFTAAPAEPFPSPLNHWLRRFQEGKKRASD
ncbi:flagellar biosynthetic protein FliO [Ammonifex degensii KC4]|uniref:Flagellar protein n=1 Tax=Ammonifex degensii (strain DSM 10501 / KC4) TaxID=429009 RepID=C9R9Y3_AMMDK|nr:flagellar biosynthetic protein FliO [Ammonifex degensii]ACX53112.1 flagellar biosynthetic protein FliO [Ammonifex degensii KC4]